MPIDRENIDSSETSTESSKVDIIKESQTIVSETRNTDMKKDDYIKILELLKTPTFERMMNMLSVKEAVIISLRLGYIDNKYFSTESIANFLGISSEEIRETTKKKLLLYRENINSIIDHAISLTTDERPKRK